MKAEDTVLGTVQDAIWDFDLFKLQQAKISFPAGIKEVVDWLEIHWDIRHDVTDRDIKLWEAQLKEWGYDER